MVEMIHKKEPSHIFMGSSVVTTAVYLDIWIKIKIHKIRLGMPDVSSDFMSILIWLYSECYGHIKVRKLGPTLYNTSNVAPGLGLLLLTNAQY